MLRLGGTATRDSVSEETESQEATAQASWVAAAVRSSTGGVRINAVVVSPHTFGVQNVLASLLSIMRVWKITESFRSWLGLK